MASRSATLLALALLATAAVAPAHAEVGADGLISVKRVYPIAETIKRIKADIAEKGITFFQEIDQTKLAAGAGIALPPSSLLIFGNPGLGSQFITAKPQAGMDWPVRLFVHQDERGDVWATYTDFGWIASRHGITNRSEQFGMASKVIGSITSSVQAK
ncbi:MAG: DUF302 domain-containing protein [Burkholderiales bacterium]